MEHKEIVRQLFAMQDIGYRNFHSKLIPNIPKERVIGVRTPQLRKFARTLAKEPAVPEFLAKLPHEYYEENNLHAFLLEMEENFEKCVVAVTEFLPYVDNWATCDMMCPKVFADHLSELRPAIREWMASPHSYAVRYGIGMLLRFYLDEAFSQEDLAEVARIESAEYYINMMRAWYFATALARQTDAALPWLKEYRLDVWTHNKTIQKAVESYRISPEQKEYLRTLRRK